MTLIAGFKYENEGCIISDFRLTNAINGDQYDVAQKFTAIDNRISIFMAGAVMLLGPIHNRLSPLINQITHNNIDDLNGILVTEITSFFEERGLNEQLQSDMIIVHLNEQCNDFKMFSLSMRIVNNEWVCNVTSDSSFGCAIIGSGSIITESNQFHNKKLVPLDIIYRNARIKNYDQGGAAFAVESEIKARLDELGNSAYLDLGICPVFLISIINGSSMWGIGRELESGSYETNGTISNSSYSVLSDGNNSARLTDNSTGQTIIATRTDSSFNIGSINQTVRFDPEGKESP